jgi:hypothetical protein
VRDAQRAQLVRGSARAVALGPAKQLAACVAALALLAAPVGCGGDDGGDGGERAEGAALAWDGTPVVRASGTGARVVIGKVKNESSRELRITGPELAVVDARGRRIKSSAVFVSTFVRSTYPHNRGQASGPANYPEAEQRRVGYLAVLDAGESTPLTVSWRERPRGPAAKRIVYGAGSLAIPAAIEGAATDG